MEVTSFLVDKFFGLREVDGGRRVDQSLGPGRLKRGPTGEEYMGLEVRRST